MGNVFALHVLPISNESHCEKFVVLYALGPTLTNPRYVFLDSPAEIPFEIIRLFVPGAR